MARCPTCGRSVPTVFEHVDTDCENWGDRGTPKGDAAEAAYNATHYVTWRVDGKLCRHDGPEDDVRDLRHFMLHISPLQRDEISEVMPKEEEASQ